MATVATLALIFGGAALFAGAVANVSATPAGLTVVQGGAGQFSVSIDGLSGSVPPRANKAPTVSYCQEWTVHADGTATCEETGSFMLDKGRNYTQIPVAVGDYVGGVIVNVDAGAPCNTTVNLTETFTVQAGSGLDFGNGLLEVSRTVAVTITCASSESVAGGCSHGYWKNHLTEWPSPYTANTTLDDVFQLGPFGTLGNVKLTDALGFTGGSGNLGKAKILLRNAVAALLNSTKGEITFAFTKDEVVSKVNAALASNDATTILALEAEFETANHGSPYCSDSVQ
jgi:hypothetical protein